MLSEVRLGGVGGNSPYLQNVLKNKSNNYKMFLFL